jgi:hypothetical protein
MHSRSKTLAARRAHQAPQATAITATNQAVLTGRNLDLCLLAVCSCALTLLCHQAVNMAAPELSSRASAPQVAQSQASSAVDLTLKSVWLTASGAFNQHNDQ